MNTTERIALAVATPLGADIGIALTVDGKSMQYIMTRSAAASLVGRVAKALAATDKSATE